MPAQRKLESLTLYPSARTSAEWADVEAAIRNTAFFSATIESEHVLANMKRLVEAALAEGLSMQEFTRQALIMLEDISLDRATPKDETDLQSLETLFDSNRLRLIFRTQTELAQGYAIACEQLTQRSLNRAPAWRFVRQPGAKEKYKRQDHVDHENDVQLKTNVDYWLDRNRPEIGGFNNPYGPWGFNSWMRTEEVEREECEKLGLINPGQPIPNAQGYAEHTLGNALATIGTASTNDFSEEQIDRIKAECSNAGINVNVLEKELSILRDESISLLQQAAFDAWLLDQF